VILVTAHQPPGASSLGSQLRGPASTFSFDVTRDYQVHTPLAHQFLYAGSEELYFQPNGFSVIAFSRTLSV